ncbi:MAG: O-antigen ligase family protein [Chitinophagaceae bacterium]|nr:O-antigen ligase family protein [Chitinophagaceae bacterium]
MLVTFIPDFIGIDSSLIKYSYWGIKVLLACWVISKSSRSFFHFTALETLCLVILFIYLANIFIDVFLDPIPILKSSRGLTDLIGFCLIIVLALSFRYDPAFHSPKSFWFFCISLVIGLILAYFLARQNIDLDVHNVRYDANSSVNTIVYGQTGCALSLVSIFGFFNYKKKLFRIFFLVLFIVGMLSIARAGSRSPVVVLALVSTFYFMARLGNVKGIIIIFVFVGLITIFINPIIGLLESMGSNLAIRLTSMVVKGESSGRDDIYSNTLNIIQGSPILGEYYFLPTGVGAGGYPHNFFLEVFLATGLLGGIPFMIMIFISLVKAYKLIKVNHPSSWIIILYLQMLVFGMFSTGLYSSQDFWVLLFYIMSMKVYLGNVSTETSLKPSHQSSLQIQ